MSDLSKNFFLKPSNLSPVTGKAAKDLLLQIEKENTEKRAILFEEAKEKAKFSGKEVFDLQKLFKYYYFPRNPQSELEYEYYVARSNCMTLKEFAKVTQEYDQYDSVF
jgi:hypothetical protein